MINSLLMFMSSLLALIFTRMNHPLAMGLMLLLQTLLVTLITGFMTQSFWFSYILFLVFLGGLLVLFIYVTSLASNEMFTLSTSTLMSVVMLTFFIICLFTVTDPFSFMNISNTEFNFSLNNPHQLYTSFSLFKLYNPPTSLITFMLVLYLIPYSNRCNHRYKNFPSPSTTKK
uniref:NADH-ubiquinone oxidoreductase chain 6 n=1 Tax=Kamimuria chungnanshana TaxID=1720338 RepID=A0A0U2KXU9_9NEOP|nr:NADH dehydrogenase subunit 6 [Kamimuria chungnanshana]ALF36423.1 NADH dehydrogenase subunit 6 [Kamimuria chungnanshana]